MGKAVLVVVVVIILLAAGGTAFVLMSPSTKPASAPAANQIMPASPPTSPATQSAAANQIALTVTSPKNNAIVTSSALRVTGQTAANAEVSVNESDVKADAKGAFTANITLSEGDNPIVVTAVDADGNYSETELTVTYQAASQ